MRVLAHAAMAALMAIGGASPVQAQTIEISVYAAGSLRGALTEVAQAWQAAKPAQSAKFTFGASGLLKDRLAGGERADVFASANMEHPQALAVAGLAEAPQSFARNQLCVLAAPGVAVSSQTLVDLLLDPVVRLGTSTPSADPSGDYTWTMFERIEQRGRAGAFKTLSGKALQLTGGPNSPPPPANRSVYGALMADGQADLFVTYCTNAVVAMREVPTLRRIEVPADINVSASYGVTVMNGASDAARCFVRFLLSPPGQGVLARHGFAAP
jgi:molybdate transport system substrate-binding protein